MMSGHMHDLYIKQPDEQKALDVKPNFPLVVASKMCDNPFVSAAQENADQFSAAAFEYTDDSLNVKFTNSAGEVLLDKDIK